MKEYDKPSTLLANPISLFSQLVKSQRKWNGLFVLIIKGDCTKILHFGIEEDSTILF